MDIQELEQAIKNGGIPAWATEETLQKVARALNVKDGIGNLNKTIGRSGDTNPRTFIGGLNAASASTGKLGKSAEVASKAVSNIKSLAGGAAGIAGTLMQTKGRFSDLNPIIDIVAEGMGSIAGSIPVVGGFFKALIGFSKEVAKLNNQILDDLITNFMALSKEGFNLSTDLQSIQLAALEAGVQFEVLTGAVLNNYAGMIAFGGSVDKATQRFASSLAYLTDPNKPDSFAYAMQSFGYGAEEATAFLGEFIDRNRNSLRLQNMTDKEVAEVAFDYAKNLRVIAELTGVQVDELKAQQMAQLTDGAFQSKLQQMRNAGLVDEAFAMEQFAGQLSAIDPALAKAYKEMTTFGNVATEQSALLMRTIPELAGAFAGQDIEAARNAVAGLAKNTDALQIGTFALLDGPNSLSQLIADLVPTAQRLAGIVEEGPTQSELENQQQRQIDQLTGANIEFETFNENLVYAGKQLDVVGAKLQAKVVEALIPAMEKQLELTGEALDKLTKLIGGGGGTYVPDNNQAITSDKIIEDYAYDYGAFGGRPAGSGMYLVGERGPELLRLSQGSMGHVYNHGQTKSMLRGRFGGGPVGGDSLTHIDMGDMGSRGVDAQGKTQRISMGLDADTTLNYFRKNGIIEIVRALMTGDGSYGVSGSAQSGKMDKTFYEAPDGSRIYGAEGMSAIVKDIAKNSGGTMDYSQGMEELIAIQKDLAKYTKKTLAKISSGDGYF